MFHALENNLIKSVTDPDAYKVTGISDIDFKFFSKQFNKKWNKVNRHKDSFEVHYKVWLEKELQTSDECFETGKLDNSQNCALAFSSSSHKLGFIKI